MKSKVIMLATLLIRLQLIFAESGVSSPNEELLEAYLRTTRGSQTDNSQNAGDDPDIFEAKNLEPEDFLAAQRLPQMDGDGIVEGGDDPMTSSGKFEGDIDLRGLPIEAYVDTFERGNKDLAADVQYNAIRGQYYRWPNMDIPFLISSYFNQYERSIIASAIEEYNQKTCIRWKPRTTQRDYVYIVKRSGCYSSVGKVGGFQELSLGRGCVQKGIVIHEMMHAVGFYHEQSRTDRDSYVHIYWQNISPWAYYNFDKYGVNQIDDLGTSYDYGSIMHYGSTAFSKTWNSVTIYPKDGRSQIGQRRGLSSNDVKKINLLYKCPSTVSGGGGEESEESGEAGGAGGTTVNCINYNAFCDSWAARGQCSYNPAYMLPYCAKACGTCSVSSCSDSGQHCGYWKKQGYCQSYRQYMTTYCRKSCDIC